MALTKISTGGVKDDAASQAKIADEAIDEARLQVSNAGTNGQFLQKSSGTGGLTWATVESDKIEEGNTSVETVDTGTDGNVSIKTEGTERLKVRNDGIVDIGGTGANTVNFNVKGTAGSGAGLTGNIGKVNIGSSYSNSPNSEGVALGQLIFGHGTNASGPIVEGSAGGSWSTNNLPSQLKFYTVPASSTTQTERLRISKDGALGIGGANYGTSGQVLTSGGTSAAPSWTAPSAGDLVHVAGFSAADSEYVTFENLTNTGVASYLIRWNGLTFQSGVSRQLRAEFKFGSSWNSESNYSQRLTILENENNNNESYTNQPDKDYIRINTEGGRFLHGELNIPMGLPTGNVAGGEKVWWGTNVSTSGCYRQDFHGFHNSYTAKTNDLTGIRFFQSTSGEKILTTGRIDLYKYTY